MKTKTKVYNSGLRLIVSTTDTKAVSMFIGVDTGSVNEDKTNNGISHFIEHMVFKGTKNRTSEQINRDFESLGAVTNAFTSPYVTAFHSQCIDENADKCFEILSDLILNPTFDETEFKKERKVIFEEIDMYEDDPGSVAYDNFICKFFEGTKMGKLLIGTKKILNKLTPQHLRDYMAKFYVPPNIVVSVAGGVDFETAEKFVNKHFACRFKTKGHPHVYNQDKKVFMAPKSIFLGLKKDINQTNIIFGLPICGVFSDDRLAYGVASFIFGGSMSSRLSERIRNKLAFVYSIHALPDFYDIGGVLNVSFATNKEHQEEAILAIKQEMDDLMNNGVSDEEFNRAKTFYKSTIILSEENSINIARHNLTNVLTFNEYKSIEDRIAGINRVTKEQVNRIFKCMFQTKNVCGVVVSSEPNTKIFAPLVD
ncbi:MAG: insulinase family protein [Christensenellaceae bacterium]|jgi:predicted Zn-dependent peptidase|nr:insulinase family protein [Christensenellaceae bacterium]